MQSISVFLDMTRACDFPWKNSHDCHMIYIFFGSCLGKVWLCQVSLL